MKIHLKSPLVTKGKPLSSTSAINEGKKGVVSLNKSLNDNHNRSIYDCVPYKNVMTKLLNQNNLSGFLKIVEGYV